MVVILKTGGVRPTFLFICLLLLWWSEANYYYATCSEKVEKSNWLQVPGFELSAKVKVIQQDSSKVDEEILVHEYYSNVEQRARLEFSSDQQVRRRSKGNPNGNNNSKGGKRASATLGQTMTSYLYYGSIAKRLLKVTAGTERDTQVRDCKLATSQMLVEDLFGSAARVDGHLTGVEWLKEREDVPDYLLGFARLLIIVSANRAKLTQSVGPSVITRNQEATRYMLKDPLGASGPDKPSQLMVYYSKSQSGTDDLPLRIWFLIKDEVEIVVDYSMVAQIDYEARATKALEGPNVFAFPLDAGCSQQVPPSKLIRRQTTPKLISFKATVANLLEERAELGYFIGYDGYAEVLRRDTLARPNFRPYSITIHDLRKHLKYNIEETRRRVASSTGGDSQCSVVYHQSQQDLLQEPVLPLEGMVEMGRASVRGVEVVAFELLTEQLPEILFPQVSYLDLRGSNRSAYIPNLSWLDRTFCVVYYFTAESVGATGHWLDGRPLGQLMRIDVMQQNHHLYRVEVSDFVWELADAPNGDRALDLFALGDRCADDQVRAEHSASLSMELEFEAAAQKYSTGLTTVTAPEALDMINKAPKRNLGLADALSRAHERLGSTQIRNVKSSAPPADELRASNATTFRLLVSAKLDLHRKVVFRPRSVAKGRLSKPGPFSSAANFEECLWEVVHRSKQFRYLLFSFCYTTCLIDERPIMVVMDGKPKVRTSNVFELSVTDNNAPCEIFSLEASEEQPVEEAQPEPRDIWAKVERDLSGKSLWLPVWPQKVGQLNLSVKQLDISNDKWSSTNGQAPEEGAPVGESVLEGIGLTADANTIRVDAKQLANDAQEAELPAPDMSYALCHSSCVASLGCRSFSLCTANSGFRLDCLMSELDFRDASLLQQIQQRSAEVQATRTKRGLITVQVIAAALVSDDEGVGSEYSKRDVELRVDRRCHLYNKRALELFRPTATEMVTELRNKGLMAADSEEQCAELCLARNMRFFQVASSIKSDFMIGEQAGDGGLVARRRVEEERNLRSTWCSSFSFIDLQAGSLPDAVRDMLDPAKLIKRGLCHMPKPPRPILPIVPLGGGAGGSPAGAVAERRLKPRVRLTHKYDFIYSSLYEPLHGVRLLALGGNRANADLSELSPEEARRHVSQNNDQAFVGSPDLETCARHCFMQNTPVKPWCRSFGFMSYTVEDQQTGGQRQQYYCVFNSITAADAKRSPLRRYLIVDAPQEASISHYEPSDFLSLENVYLSRLYRPPTATGGAEQFRLETLGILVVILMALISSAAFTLLVGERVLATLRPRRESAQNPTIAFLNSLVVDGNSSSQRSASTHKSFQDDIVLPERFAS